MLSDYVNIFQGTSSTFTLSYGNTLPLAAIPRGMNHWTIQTSEEHWLFNYNEPKVQGIRMTHQPSPWIRDYSALTFMPQTGELISGASFRSSIYRKSDGVFTPYFMELNLFRYRTKFSFAPTERGAAFQIEFPDENKEKRLIISTPTDKAEFKLSTDGKRLEGYTKHHNGGMPENGAAYFVILFDEPVISNSRFSGGIALEFSRSSRKCEYKIASSFISIAQAEINLKREVLPFSLDEIKNQGAEIWEKHLSKIQIETSNDEYRKTFYSCLYRSFIFPRKFHEFDINKKMLHYSPFDGKIHEGPLYTDNGFWDTYRTLFPLLSIIDREIFGEMCAGFLNAYKEGGWLPQWMSPGYRDCMIGTHASAVLAQAIMADVKGFDYELAYEAMKKDATTPSDIPGVGRTGLEEYIKLGYLPADKIPHSASVTMDYAANDFCLALVAEKLGRKDDAAIWRERSKNYRNVFSQEVNFMRGRNADGSWIPFDEFDWGGPYIEGGAWQSTWAVPHEQEDLMTLMGGKEKFAAKLEKIFSTPPYFNAGTYKTEIHEMTEMAVAEFGQYAHSNQPVHNVIYLLNTAGRPDKTRHWVRKVLTEMYNSGEKGFPGDEDNGEMAAWYVLSSCGIFPACPGKTDYFLGTSLFDKAVLHLENGNCIKINRSSNGKNSINGTETEALSVKISGREGLDLQIP